MPLFNNKEIEKAYNARMKRESRISDLEYSPSDRMMLFHDEGVIVKTSLDETIAWDPYNLCIAAFMDCKNNPPFPKAHAGNGYLITGSGMFGTIPVIVGDILIPIVDVEESIKVSTEAYWTMIPSRRIRAYTHRKAFTMDPENTDVTVKKLPPRWNAFVITFLSEPDPDLRLYASLVGSHIDLQGEEQAIIEPIDIILPINPSEVTVYVEKSTSNRALHMWSTGQETTKLRITVLPGF